MSLERGRKMAEKSALAKEYFAITSAACVVFFVIPWLGIFMRMQQALVGPTAQFGFTGRQAYLAKDFSSDLTWLIVLGVLAVIPPLFTYFKYAGLSALTDNDPDNS
jgi:hypothetical protein